LNYTRRICFSLYLNRFGLMVDASKEVAAFVHDCVLLASWKVVDILKMTALFWLNISATTYCSPMTYRLFYNISQFK